MVGRSCCNIIKALVCLLIVLGLADSAYSQDKQIGGIINVYRRVVSIGPGPDNVILNSVDSISPGDTVILIQMKGVVIYESETSFFGSYRESVGVPGLSEFLIVYSVNPGTKSVVFTNDIKNSYNVTGMVQLVKVPSYNNVTVASDLTCQPWDSINKTGGVLAMIVERNLSLSANIDVTGKGFDGGAILSGQGICLGTNTPLYDKFSYPDTYTNSGFKGESQAFRVFIDATNEPSNYPAYAKGKGNNFTGGGGGNGRFSGGGGGANYGIGGKGGREIGTCTPLPGDGGIGGRQVKFTELDGRMFLGGGGGSSTYEIGSVASPGSRGGGIIIILCDTLKGNGRAIRADGATPKTPSNLNAGAGGGGGGGSIAIHQQSFSIKPASSAITISANGGKGGNSNVSFGEGGGGGGGLIVTHNTSDPANVLKTVSGGAGGTRTGGTTSGTAGTAGESLTTYIPVLTGFLFNSVRSSITEDQVDSVCSNMLPPKILGTQPVGGIEPYTYLWEKSYNQTTWIQLVNDADPVNYTPIVKETVTVYFRRTVTDASVPAVLSDVSKPLKIIVQPFIRNNIVGNSDTLCILGDPPLLQQLTPGLIVPSSKYLFYNWQDSSSSATWGATRSTLASYDPPAGLDRTTWYRRTVTSGRCVDSTGKAKMTVLNAISNNSILNTPPDICYGMTFTNIIATNTPALSGGDNIFKFKWIGNINGAGWATAPGVNNGPGYNPSELSQRIPWNEYYYRRVVYSGSNDVCKDTSAAVHLKDFPAITNNTISPNQTIGHDSIPVPLIGLQPANGDGTYSYLWLSRTKVLSWNTAAPVNNTINYYPSSLTDTTYYRRVVRSYVCADSSNTLIINVHKAILNNAISFVSGFVEDTVCYGSVPGLLKGTIPTGGSRIPGVNNPADYGYKWYISINNGNTWSQITGATGQDYQPVALTQTVLYRREVGSPAVNPLSVTTSNNIKITVLPLISNVIAGVDSVCYNTQPAILQGVVLSGGDNIYRFTWQDSTNVSGWRNVGNLINYQPPNLILPSKYRRIVYSGSNNACISTSNTLNIGIRQLPTGSITSTADTTICEGSKVPLKIHLTGKKNWAVIYNENITNGPIINIAKPDTTLLVSPVPASVHSLFSYTLGSVKDKFGCAATSLTGTRKVDVYKMPTANAGRDTVVCGSKYTLNAIPSVGTGKWFFPPAVVSSTENKAMVTIAIDSTFAGKNNSQKFYWEELNWVCRNRDSVIVTFDKRVSPIYAGPDTILFSFDNVYHIVAAPVNTWETGKWSVIGGTGDFNNNSSNKAIVTNLSEGINIFLWSVTNDKCKLEDQVKVDVRKEFIPRAFSPNSDGINDKFTITGLDLTNQIGELIIVNGAGAEVFSTSNRDSHIWTDWDGKNSKGFDLPEDTYYYLLKVTSKTSNQVYKRSGFIVLKRN